MLIVSEPCVKHLHHDPAPVTVQVRLVWVHLRKWELYSCAATQHCCFHPPWWFSGSIQLERKWTITCRNGPQTISLQFFISQWSSWFQQHGCGMNCISFEQHLQHLAFHQINSLNPLWHQSPISKSPIAQPLALKPVSPVDASRFDFLEAEASFYTSSCWSQPTYHALGEYPLAPPQNEVWMGLLWFLMVYYPPAIVPYSI